MIIILSYYSLIFVALMGIWYLADSIGDTDDHQW